MSYSVGLSMKNNFTTPEKAELVGLDVFKI